MIEMTIDSIRVSLMNYQRVVILKEKYSNRYLPIWIGPSEADAIAVKLQNVELARPLTHDLLQSVIASLGAKPDYVVVNDLQKDTFYAKLALNANGDDIEVDSRPSDALALAVRADIPIYAEETVLSKAGIILDEETGKPLSEGKVEEHEMEGLSAFKDFIKTLDLEDFRKRKS
ncbi:bifunctional nuclease family protein [Candidatus Bipolaricaulota bacterium]|nr:bifunctional nuclease family protein [Candidatus Bipolaricaulota bacterium]